MEGGGPTVWPNMISDRNLPGRRISLSPHFITLHVGEVFLETGEDLFGLQLLPLGDRPQPLVAKDRRLLLGVLQVVLPHVHPKVFHNLQ